MSQRMIEQFMKMVTIPSDSGNEAEFIAYLDLARHVRDHTMSPRACEIATYALCGFANVPSIAIQIGGLSAIAPDRRPDFVRIGPRAMVAGALACWMTGCLAGLFIA